MGPTFFNLRIICDCLGRAIRRHIDYSQGVFWFLDDLTRAKKALKMDIAESGGSDVTAFSYHFKEELKLTIGKARKINDDEDLDCDNQATEIFNKLKDALEVEKDIDDLELDI